MSIVYLLALCISITGLAVLDRRFKLAFWHDARRTWATILVGMVVFIVWDLVGIQLGIFRQGETAFQLPFMLLPEFPIEELFFLFLLCYNTLLVYQGVVRWRTRTLS